MQERVKELEAKCVRVNNENDETGKKKRGKKETEKMALHKLELCTFILCDGLNKLNEFSGAMYTIGMGDKD